METSSLDVLAREIRRRALVRTLQVHQDWSLDDVLTLVERGGEIGGVLAKLTVADLRGASPEFGGLVPDDGGPLIDLDHKRAALAAERDSFDPFMLRVLREAGGRWVGARYLRARLGGPRWKLQASTRRLVAAGLVMRSGTTADTRYRAAGDHA